MDNLVVVTHVFYDEIRFLKYNEKPTEKIHHQMSH